MLTRQKGYFLQIRQEREAQSEIRKIFPTAAVLRGLLIALPIVVIFAMLLASADGSNYQKIADFFDLFDSGKITEYVFRFFRILACAYLLIGVFLHALSQSKDEKLAGEGGIPLSGFWALQKHLLFWEASPFFSLCLLLSSFNISLAGSQISALLDIPILNMRVAVLVNSSPWLSFKFNTHHGLSNNYKTRKRVGTKNLLLVKRRNCFTSIGNFDFRISTAYIGN